MLTRKKTIHLGRYREIAAILARHGLGWMALELNLGGLIPFHWGLLGHPRRAEPYTQAEHMRMAIEDLGVTFIKLGQILSTRPDLLAPEYIEQFSKLQDAVPPFSYEEVSRIIHKELGLPPDKLFKTFETKPMASASVGQAHKAILHNGTKVVVKVQRPGIDVLIERDIEVLSTLAHFASSRFEFGESYDIEGWIEEFAFTLRNELDYTREGQNADRIRRNFGDDPKIHVPAVYWEYTTSKVLTMEEISGTKIQDFESLEKAGLDRANVARNYAHIFLTMAYDHGFFHADPHPGNFFVLPNEAIGLIDYGMVGRLDENMRLSLLRILMSMGSRDTERLVDEFLALGVARKAPRRNVLKRDLDHFIQLFYDRPMKEIAAAQTFSELVALARRNKLQLPSDLILYFKVIAMYEGIGVQLDPDFRLMEFAEPYFKRFWLKSHSIREQARRIREAAQELTELGLEGPRHARRLFGQMERGELVFTSRIEGLEETLAELQSAANRISMSILAAALIVGVGLLMLIYHPPVWAKISGWFFAALFGIAVLFSLGLLFSIWRAGRIRKS